MRGRVMASLRSERHADSGPRDSTGLAAWAWWFREWPPAGVTSRNHGAIRQCLLRLGQRRWDLWDLCVGGISVTNVTGSKRPQAASAAPCLAVGYSLRLPLSNDAITRPNSSPEAVNPSNNEAR
jgi:hypothetical protein